MKRNIVAFVFLLLLCLPMGGCTPQCRHQEGEWVVGKEPTCSSEGRRDFVCTGCGEVLKTEPIAEAEHFLLEWTTVYPPSCEAEGLRCLYCKQCGKVLEEEPIEKRPHEFVLGECVRCGFIDEEYRPALLTIIDDDGSIRFLTDIVPMIEKLGVPIATAVSPSRVYSGEPRWMDWDDIAQCHERGAEILSHTYMHYTGTEIRRISDEQIVEYYQKARDELLSRGYPGGDILVYSSSTGNIARVQADAAKVYKCGIKIGGSTVNDAWSPRYALSRFRLDYAATEGREDWCQSDILSFIDQVADRGGWEIFMFHTSNAKWRQRVRLNPDGTVMLDEEGRPIPMFDAHGGPVLDPEGRYPTVGTEVYLPMLENAILYAQSNGVNVVSATDAYHIIFERSSAHQ